MRSTRDHILEGRMSFYAAHSHGPVHEKIAEMNFISRGIVTTQESRISDGCFSDAT